MREANQSKQIQNLRRIRGDLDGLRGKQYWRSLEELAETEEFNHFLEREFPENASEWTDPVRRRDFLRLMGASLALAGLGACTKQPLEKIVPYVKQPEEIVPGRPLYYATAVEKRGYGVGVLVESHMGRPTKIEGNPQHPASLGATDAQLQAAILGLYDPDRTQVVRKAGRISTWDTFLQEWSAPLQTQLGAGGRGLRILTETVTSPTLGDLMAQLRERFPESRWHRWQPTGRHHSRRGVRQAFGRDLEVRCDLTQAEVIVSLGSDFLFSGPGSVRYARDFSVGRKVRGGAGEMNRLYVVEPTPTVTGGMADHRLVVRPSRLEPVARSLASRLGAASGGGQSGHEAWVESVAGDLSSRSGRCLVVAGEEAPPGVHALAHACNLRLGAVGKTVFYTEPVEVEPVDHPESISQLAADMESGTVEMLLILGGNPVHNAPADLDFSGKLGKVPLRVHLSLYEDETSAQCHWHIPAAHDLESWGDVRAYDGTVSIRQPLIAPLYGGKTAAEVVSALLGKPGVSSYQLVQDYWRQRNPEPNFEKVWRQAVHDGVVAGTEQPAIAVSLVSDWDRRTSPAVREDLEVVFRRDPSIDDGGLANNGWLQELPRPFTKLTWDNAVLMSPATADGLGLSTGDRVRVSLGDRETEGPVWLLPGQAEGTICLHLGYGRTHAGRVGDGVGFDAYRLRVSDALWQAAEARIERTGSGHRFASTQSHFAIQVEESEEAGRRHLVREAGLAEFREHPDLIHEMAHEFPEELTLFPEWEYRGYAWGMAVDLGSCTGCNACVIACQAENNIPVVGKNEVVRGREMHWMRIDHYFKGAPDDPEFVHQPILCQHCENAPCEVVCPVAATSHSAEGINEMTYNRCVGTRYCSNNCPYKVRRFNFILYQDWDTPSLKLMRNPDVTVRSRGVMEKCTYCVQRVNAARIQAKLAGRKIRDGEVRTACQAVCPSQAIAFGDINDPLSEVSHWKADKLNYGILTELNTRPRTTYLARLRNRNPEIVNE